MEAWTEERERSETRQKKISEERHNRLTQK